MVFETMLAVNPSGEYYRFGLGDFFCRRTGLLVLLPDTERRRRASLSCRIGLARRGLAGGDRCLAGGGDGDLLRRGDLEPRRFAGGGVGERRRRGDFERRRRDVERRCRDESLRR